MIWISNNIIGILAIVVSSFIAYHVYFLSRRIVLKDRLTHKEEISKQVEEILSGIRNGLNSKVELVNVKKYLKHYPQDNNLSKDGYTYLGAELKGLRFDGIEFFCGIRELYKEDDGRFTLKNDNNETRYEKNAFEVGVIPYEWVEYIDRRGDEFNYRPQFFVKFKGLKKYPYKYLTYYMERDTYDDNNDPRDFKWSQIDFR